MSFDLRQQTYQHTGMNDVSSVSVKRLVQWSNSGHSDRLRINDAYPRIDTAWTIQDKGKYLYDVLHGVDVSIITINVTERHSYIIDGACRLRVLTDFQQDKLPMVVSYSKMPDGISFRPYAVPPAAYSYKRFEYEAGTLVEALYDGLQAHQKHAFLQAQVDVRKYSNMRLADEKQLYWQTNYVCPSSPVSASEYDEAEEFAEVASMLSEKDRAVLVHLMHLIGGVHRHMACAELLHFVRKLLAHDGGSGHARNAASAPAPAAPAPADEEDLDLYDDDDPPS